MATGRIEYIDGVHHPSEFQIVECIVSNKNEPLSHQIGAEAEQLETSSWRFVTDHDDAETSDKMSETKLKPYLEVSFLKEMQQILQQNVL